MAVGYSLFYHVLLISLVRSKLLYYSSLWRPHLLKDIELLEKVQRLATKFVLNDYTSDYKTRLIQLGMLPLMYIYEIADILFFIKSLKTPTDKFNILNYVNFNTGSTTKLHHKTSHTNAAMNSYFVRIPRLWNSLPIIDLTQSLAVIKQLQRFHTP